MAWEREDFDSKPLTAERLNNLNDGIDYIRNMLTEKLHNATPTSAGLVRIWLDEGTGEFNLSVQN